MLYVLVSDAKNCLRHEIAEDIVANSLDTLRVICTSSTSVSRQKPSDTHVPWYTREADTRHYRHAPHGARGV